MIDDLFESSKINAGALRLKFHDVAVEGLVADAVESTTPAAREPRVLVDVRIEGGRPTVSGSDAELTRVLRNLPGNAVRHPPEDGGVTLVPGVDGAQAWLAVQDSCGGTPGDDLPRVFEMAFRGAQARSPMPDAAGAGLALAIARGLVERHAAVAVENHGAGCRFEVRLPESTESKQPGHTWVRISPSLERGAPAGHNLIAERKGRVSSPCYPDSFFRVSFITSLAPW